MAWLNRQLLDEVRDAVIAVTPDGRILSWNRAAETMLGHSSDEVVGQQLTELIVFDGFYPGASRDGTNYLIHLAIR